MSRCFPFPPPGYEKTPRADGPDSLLEKKHKDKKHKKNKKDKEKREGKEKKDKERSKDEHKDKKDRNERHKDKKDKNKDKSRESEEGTARHGEAHHEQKFGDSSKKPEEIKDSKFKEEFVRRIQDEKGTANRSVENFTAATQRSREDFGATPAMENARTAVNKMRPNSVNATQKNNGLGQQTNITTQQKTGTATRHGEKFTSTAQRTREGFIAAPTMYKERVKGTAVLPNFTDSTPRKEGMERQINYISILVQKKTESPRSEMARGEIGISSPYNPVNAVQKGKDRVSRSMENVPTSVQRFDSLSTSSAAAGEMDRGIPRPTLPSPSITIRKPNGVVRPPESFSISTERKPDAGSISPAMGKEKDHGRRKLQNNISTDHKQVNPKLSSTEKIADGRTERMEKVRDGAPDDAKKEKDKKSNRHEKKHRKDKDKHKEKKKEKERVKEKQEHDNKEHDKLIENSINHQIDSLHLKSSALSSVLPVDDAAPADDNIKKRKNHETNGYLQNHNGVRPTKLLRTNFSNTDTENGTASHVAAPLSSVKPDTVNIVKVEKLLDKKEEKINCTPEAQQSSADSGLQDPLSAVKNGTSSKRPSHPDSKYLSQIYAVPEVPQVTERLELDDQDWLFNQGSLQLKKPKSESEADGASQVWSQALKIDSADVIALPYIIPF